MEELQLDAQPVVIRHNFETITAELDKILEDADTVVTEDGIKDAKKKATELNQLAETINRRRIDKVKEISAPIKEFEDKAKALAQRCKEGREKLLVQVARFEEKRLEQCLAQLTELLEKLYTEHEIRGEFQTIDPRPLVKLSALTPSGRIAASTGRELRAEVNRVKGQQLTTDLRLSELEAASFRAGLRVPLTREHVEGILFAPDAVYKDRLGALIDKELIRQGEVERIAREQAEKIARDEVAAEQQRQEAERTAPAAEQMAPDLEQQRQAGGSVETGSTDANEGDIVVKDCRITDEEPAPVDATGPRRVFDCVVRLRPKGPPGYTVAQMRSALLERLRDAGVESSIIDVEVFDVTDEQAAQ